MSLGLATTRAPVDWQPIREAFCTRSPTPSYTELSGEFSLSVSAISRTASEEDWAGIRAKGQELRLKESGATEMLLQAINEEGELTQKARRFVMNFISTSEMLRQQLEEEEGTKTSTRITSLNNLGFALANIGRFVESVASISFSGKLARAKQGGAGSEAGQPWDKGMLQQINVTVQNIQKEAQSLQKAEPVAEAEKSGPAGAF